MCTINSEANEIEALLRLFRPYLEKVAQPYYDVIFSQRFGYLFIQFYPDGNGESVITSLENSRDLLLQMFSWITLDVLALELEGEHMTMDASSVRSSGKPLSPFCASIPRRRNCPERRPES